MLYQNLVENFKIFKWISWNQIFEIKILKMLLYSVFNIQFLTNIIVFFPILLAIIINITSITKAVWVLCTVCNHINSLFCNHKYNVVFRHLPTIEYISESLKKFLQTKMLDSIGQPHFWQMEAGLNVFKNGRRPQVFQKWKTTSIYTKIEDDLHVFIDGRQPQSLANGRWP